MSRIRLIHMKARPPLAFVIDLSRLPMQGRDVAVALRHAKATRAVPIVFVEGDRKKVNRVRATLPDAIYTTWKRVERSLSRAIVRPPRVESVPRSVFEGYSEVPLWKKLGIVRGSTVALVRAPRGFKDVIASLPLDVNVHARADSRRDLTLWFVRSKRDLTREIARMLPSADNGGLWIAWPKQSSALATDLTQSIVRETALAAGLVDYKVCAIDSTWSGLKLSRHRAQRAKKRATP
jgi:CheY-like chemotaxis protein